MTDEMHYEHPAWCKMETALQEYEDAREDILKKKAGKLGQDGEQQLAQWTTAADALLKGVQELAGTEAFDGLTELASANDFQDKPAFELLVEHVCIAFGWEAMGMLESAPERFVDLLLLLRDRKPSARAREFLQRVARCYLFGFDSECVVMCRAVLDRAFADCEAPVSNLCARIEAAKIDKDARKAANAVRQRGNDGVHKTPDKGDALDAVRKTTQVLDALEQAKGR